MFEFKKTWILGNKCGCKKIKTTNNPRMASKKTPICKNRPPPTKNKKAALKLITPKVPMSGCFIKRKLTSPTIIKKGKKPNLSELISFLREAIQEARYKIKPNFKNSDG